MLYYFIEKDKLQPYDINAPLYKNNIIIIEQIPQIIFNENWNATCEDRFRLDAKY